VSDSHPASHVTVAITRYAFLAGKEGERMGRGGEGRKKEGGKREMEGRLSLKLKSGYALASTHKILLLFTSISSHPSLQHFYPRDVVRGIFATATWLAGWLGGWVCVCHSRYCIKTTKRILLLQRVRRLIARIQRFDDEIDKFRYKKKHGGQPPF